ncbi:ABC transporter ATP-binding protein [Rhizobium rhizoryzae]|uniref:Osmoprotectant transport system ATP-binding protein n=1 Tax=Rhizobium rhizoryzae TaxID=451876 RepID=A0A7W6PQY5_9HYPH|nr:ABC transporter ATP-binding protein [Rhizobium rhizoryzae]MBB4142155.1 osmoprotectant transport system ATP-binding protein [Rhizobium rhizoryzae]
MIEIDEISKLYDGRAVVDRVSMQIPASTITAIVGTSGSGKTTLMRMVNRLIDPTSGKIKINGQDITCTQPHELRRRIGYAIQGHGLFPHQTVYDNIATVPRLLKWDRAKIEQKVRELLALFQLEFDSFARRYPHELSGGQQQRVGVARALAAEPDLLLMDEPFGALDPIIRAKAQSDLRDIQRKLGTTILLVTHDMDEAFRLSDRIAVMNAGKLLQYAEPRTLLTHPADSFVAEMVGQAERAFRLLSLNGVDAIAEDGQAAGAALPADLTQREALSDLLWSGRDAAPIAQPDGRAPRRVTLSRLLAAAAER